VHFGMRLWEFAEDREFWVPEMTEVSVIQEWCLLLEDLLDMKNEAGVSEMGIYGKPIVFWTRYLLDGLVQRS
jgi:hypothetical protein